MRRTIAAITIVGCAAAALGLAPSPDPARASEVARIRAHFDSVLVELRDRDVGAMAPEQRAARAELMGTLRAYRDAGEFPRNHDFPGQAVPYFVDRGTGVLCAVAHLLASTGRLDIVHRVALMDNNVWVADLAGDTAFGSWLDTHGLSLSEAARIQVPYVGDPPVSVDPIQLRANIGDSRIAPDAAVRMASLGAIYFSTRAVLRFRQSAALKRAAGQSRSEPRVSLAPAVAPATGSSGIALNIRF